VFREAVNSSNYFMWERFLVLRTSVIRAGILLISGIAATGAIRPQQPARTATTTRTSARKKERVLEATLSAMAFAGNVTKQLRILTCT
jgi:hypothetical protein